MKTFFSEIIEGVTAFKAMISDALQVTIQFITRLNEHRAIRRLRGKLHS